MRTVVQFLKTVFVRLKPTVIELIGMAIVFSSFSMLFVSGSFNNKTKVEKIAFEMTTVVRNEGQANIVCENKDGSILASESFSKYINDQFYETSPFKSVIGYNIDKRVDCSLDELGELGSNPSFLTSTYFTNHYNNDNKIIFDRYYFELLFKETNTSRPDNVSNFVYITKTQADYLISNNSDCDSYEDVINKTITLTIDGEDAYIWKIANIINDNNLFCKSADLAFDNYVVCFTLVPDALKQTEAMLLSMYDFEYSNINFISLIETNFSNKKFSFSSQKENQNQSIIKLVNYLNNTKLNNVTNILSVVSFIVFSLPLGLIIFYSFKKGIYFKNIFEVVVSAFLAWITFFVIFKVSKSILFFSNIALVIFVSMFLVMFFCLFVIWLIEKYGRKNTII